MKTHLRKSFRMHNNRMSTEVCTDALIGKKRRGRKPKGMTVVSSTVVDGMDEHKGESTDIVANRRGRKPKVVFAFDSQQQSSKDDDVDVILKLKVTNTNDVVNADGHCKEVDDKNDDNTIHAYNEGSMSNYSSVTSTSVSNSNPSYVSTQNVNVVQNTTENDESIKINKVGTNKVVEILKDFEEKAKNNEWPVATKVACYWCCHRFDTPPVGLPCKYCDGKFYVTGCFCSLECASAYNVMYLRDSNMEERMNLIGMMSRCLGYTGIVKCAPVRESLALFGGNMSIEEFRSYGSKMKSINVHFPPMVVLTQQLEEVNDSDVTSKLKYVPLDTTRIDKYKERMKLRRSIPVNANNNTLENVMQFNVKT